MSGPDLSRSRRVLRWSHADHATLTFSGRLSSWAQVFACAVVCHAERGRWRPQADDSRV